MEVNVAYESVFFTFMEVNFSYFGGSQICFHESLFAFLEVNFTSEKGWFYFHEGAIYFHRISEVWSL